MGIQNATARKLAVPDLTTTVLTLTITGVAADSSIAGGSGSVAGRRLVAVAAMFVGALTGAALADEAGDTEVVCLVNRVPEQRGLPDAGSADEQQRAGHTAFCVAEECVDRGPLGCAAHKEVPQVRPLSAVDHAHHEPLRGLPYHTITADRPAMANVPSATAPTSHATVKSGTPTNCRHPFARAGRRALRTRLPRPPSRRTESRTERLPRRSQPCVARP